MGDISNFIIRIAFMSDINNLECPAHDHACIKTAPNLAKKRNCAYVRNLTSSFSISVKVSH